MSFEKRVRTLRAHRDGDPPEHRSPAPRAPKTEPPRRRTGWLIVKWTLVVLFLGGLLGGGGLAALFYVYGRDLPKVERLTDYDPPTVTRMYGSRGELLAEYAEDEGYRTVVPLARIPKHVADAVLAAEDADF